MSQSLNLLGATLTSNNTTSVADFSNFAKVKVAVSNADDAAARNDYVNNKITDLGNSVLKLSSSTETISSLGAITANKSYISVMMDVNSSNILSNINAVNTLENGTTIILQANNPSSTITVNSNNNIRLNNGVACSLTGYNTLQLIYSSVSNSWLELNRTIIAAPPTPITPILSLSNISKTINDLSFSPFPFVTTNSTGVLSYSLSGSSSVATISGEIITITGVGIVIITVSLAASDDGLYSAANASSTLNVTNSTLLVLDGNGVTIKTIPTLSEFSLPTVPYFTYENPRGTGSEWFAIVRNTSKEMITSYANGYSDGINYFKPSPQLPPVIFNNIVTTFMTDMSFMFTGITTFNANIGSWDTSNVTNMQSMFDGAFSFTNGGNDSISQWDTTNVTNMQNIFNGTYGQISSFANFNR